MTKYDREVFERFQKNLSGKTPFDNAVTVCVGTDKEQIETFINETSIFDLQDHFRAAGSACAPLLDLSEHIVLLRNPKQRSGTHHPLYNVGYIAHAKEWIAAGKELPGHMLNSHLPVEKDPVIIKFFNVLVQLKTQDAKASMILVESWIGKDLADAQMTTEKRNAVHSLLLRHQLNIP